jgi:hypothetical protein
MLDTEQMEAITLIVITFIPIIVVSVAILIRLVDKELKEVKQ